MRRALILRKGQEGRPRELQGSQLHLSPWAGDGAANPGNRFPAHKGQEGDQESIWIYEKSCLTNLRAFCTEVTGLVDKGRAVGVVYLDFSKVFDTISHSILIEKLTKYE